MFADKIVFVEYLADDSSDTDKSGYVPHPSFPSGVRINIQPASAELTALSEGEVFKTYQAFTTASGVVEGMRLTVSGTSAAYLVRGREAYDYGPGQHYKLTLIKPGT